MVGLCQLGTRLGEGLADGAQGEALSVLMASRLQSGVRQQCIHCWQATSKVRGGDGRHSYGIACRAGVHPTAVSAFHNQQWVKAAALIAPLFGQQQVQWEAGKIIRQRLDFSVKGTREVLEIAVAVTTGFSLSR